MPGLERMLQKWEREEYGTNDMPEILGIIHERYRQERQDALTGMPEEQADWDSDEVE